jgi:hypothetical protein
MIVLEVNRVQIKCAMMDENGRWLSWPPGTWIYTYRGRVNGRWMDLVLAGREEISEQCVRERNDGIALAAFDRALVKELMT